MPRDRFDDGVALSATFKLDPTQTVPTPEQNAALLKVLSHDQDTPCPFCANCPCEHWNGVGWTNAALQRANAGKHLPADES